MKVGIIYLGRHGAGGAISLEIAKHLDEYARVFVVLSEQGEIRPVWSETGLAVRFVPTFTSLSDAAKQTLVFFRLKRIIDLVLQEKPDALVFPMFHVWSPVLQFFLRRIPTVIFVHDVVPHPDLQGKVFGWLENFSIAQADRCVVLSPQLQEPLVERGCPVARVDVLTLGPLLSQAALDPAASEIPTLLFFGRIVPYKGIEILLEAYRQLRQGRSARLLLAGEGDLSPYASALAGLPDVEIINRWIGEQEIAEIFSRAHLVVLPYTSASQSGVIPVAASLGLPVLATRTGGIPGQLEHGKTGWLVEPGSAPALLDGMRHLLQQPEEMRQLGQALKDEFFTRRSWRDIAGKLNQILETVTQERGR